MASVQILHIHQTLSSLSLYFTFCLSCLFLIFFLFVPLCIVGLHPLIIDLLSTILQPEVSFSLSVALFHFSPIFSLAFSPPCPKLVAIESISIPKWTLLNNWKFNSNIVNEYLLRNNSLFKFLSIQPVAFPPTVIRLFPILGAECTALWLIGEFNQRDKWRQETLTFER